MTPEEYCGRVRALEVRGLRGPLTYELVYVGDVRLLEQLEQASDDDLVKVSGLWEERAQLQQQVGAAPLAEPEWVPATRACPVCQAAGR